MLLLRLILPTLERCYPRVPMHQQKWVSNSMIFLNWLLMQLPCETACSKWTRFLASIHFLQGALWFAIHTENSDSPEFSSLGMIGPHILILNSLLIIYALRNQMQATFCNTVILDLALYRKGYFGDELMCHSSAKKGPFVLLLAQITGCKVNNGHFFRRKYSKFFKAPSRDASVIELTFLPSFPTSFLRLLYSRCLFSFLHE